MLALIPNCRFVDGPISFSWAISSPFWSFQVAVSVELLAPQLYDRYQNDRYLITKAGISTREVAKATIGPITLAAFCRTLSFPAPRRAPPLRPLAGEVDALDTALLSAYRPPASIDRHSEFITASAAIKEARELDSKVANGLNACAFDAPTGSVVESGPSPVGA